MDEEEEKRREEENRRFLKRLIDSEAETRAEPPVEPKKDEPANSTGTTRESTAPYSYSCAGSWPEDAYPATHCTG